VEHRGALDALAQALLARETLNEEEILEVTGLARAPALASGKLAGSAADSSVGAAP
jgi:cell division protease FtsH